MCIELRQRFVRDGALGVPDRTFVGFGVVILWKSCLSYVERRKTSYSHELNRKLTNHVKR